jgi:hypothetical protein
MNDLKALLDMALDGNASEEAMKVLKTEYGRCNNKAKCPCGSGKTFEECCKPEWQVASRQKKKVESVQAKAPVDQAPARVPLLALYLQNPGQPSEQIALDINYDAVQSPDKAMNLIDLARRQILSQYIDSIVMQRLQQLRDNQTHQQVAQKPRIKI